VIARWLNGIRKVAAGLRPFGESVWPGVHNDLFVAHASIYEFAAGYCQDKRVADAGCGTGYGTYRLANAGAASVLGIDVDPRNIRYARRHFAHPRIELTCADLEQWSSESIDLVVASNSLEHLSAPQRFIERLGGAAIIAVPPIRNAYEQSLHSDIAYHRAPLSVDEWIAIFEAAKFSVRYFVHQSPPGLDFASPKRSRFTVDDFAFHETDYMGLRLTPTLTAIFLLERADSFGGPA